MKTMIQIVRDGLKINGYDGLYAPDFECGCELSDLNPCGQGFAECLPGYKRVPKEGELNPSGYDFFIVPAKTEPPKAEGVMNS